MKQGLLLLLAFTCVYGAPAGTTPSSSCKDAFTNAAAAQAMDKINEQRHEGYVFSLERLSNAHQMQHGATGSVYYLTIDVLETKCHVLSKKNWRNCEVRDIGEHQVYGQCRAVIYINRVHRVSRLYKYSCAVRPVPPSKIVMVCPDCPVLFPLDNAEVQKTMRMGMEKFNKESTLANYFTPLNVTRAISQGGIITLYSVEFTIQETVCSNRTDIAEVSKCELMACEFAHKGLCRATHSISNGNEHLDVKCDIFESEAAEEEKKRHLLGGEIDHSHSHTANMSVGHDHIHDHTHSHSTSHAHNHDHPEGHKHDHDHKAPHTHSHTKDSGHHHTHEHNEGHGHSHSHAHSHVHSHEHDHAHTHHAKAHNHTQDLGQHPHHNYNHSDGETHEHDHELALDHEHKHTHLHEHEHHHHHHEHQHESQTKQPEGVIYFLPSMDKPMTLPSHPDQPVADPAQPSTLPFHPDPQIPGEREPTIKPFPTTLSKECPADFKTKSSLIKEVFAQDPLFKIAPTCEKPVIRLSMFAQCQ